MRRPRPVSWDDIQRWKELHPGEAIPIRVEVWPSTYFPPKKRKKLSTSVDK